MSRTPNKTIDPAGQRTTLTYNAFGQPVTVTDPTGNTTVFEYDSVGNLIMTADPLGNQTSRQFRNVLYSVLQKVRFLKREFPKIDFFGFSGVKSQNLRKMRIMISAMV